MKIVLVGYGKMGKTIEKIAVARGHQVAARIDVDNHHDLAAVNADVAIEFSHPHAAFENVKQCLELGLPVVCGTTGWLARKEEIEALAYRLNGAFFYASNYSLGVNLFFRLNEALAAMMSNFDHYSVTIDEVHHTEKKDAPSGTAITLAEGLIKHLKGKRKWVNHDTSESSEVPIKSFRIDEVPGTHIIKYASNIDDIEIKHIAHTREGFALGAVTVAEWLIGKKGVLNMDDFLKF
ncbi:MAG TPA: 4-hydroxy-tetrahydrodipicolinate reductase [Chryseosolibacter sp.]|nr:4-hydroxy-tetrahydrodipicolinate reductase [Chryseosolibacter sp.]